MIMSTITVKVDFVVSASKNRISFLESKIQEMKENAISTLMAKGKWFGLFSITREEAIEKIRSSGWSDLDVEIAFRQSTIHQLKILKEMAEKSVTPYMNISQEDYILLRTMKNGKA